MKFFPLSLFGCFFFLASLVLISKMVSVFSVPWPIPSMQRLPFTDTNNFSYYVTQYYCILLLLLWDVSTAGLAVVALCILSHRNSAFRCCVTFARCVSLAAEPSSPFNIIFTIQSDYTSYSFMSSHINDFIMCYALLHCHCQCHWLCWAKCLTNTHTHTHARTRTHTQLKWDITMYIGFVYAANWMALYAECEQQPEHNISNQMSNLFLTRFLS